MGVFKTYKEAVIANGSTKGVYKDLLSGCFQFEISQPGSWVECNPADYLETLESFLDSGKQLKCGDDVVGIHGTVITIFDESVQEWNCRTYNNRERFILQAAADNEDTETSEEHEVFEAMSFPAAAWPEQGETVSTPVGVGGFVAKVTKRGEVRYIVQFENSYAEFTPEAVTPFDHEYEAGKKMRELWLNCWLGEGGCSLSFESLSTQHRNAWIELAKRVKVLDNA